MRFRRTAGLTAGLLCLLAAPAAAADPANVTIRIEGAAQTLVEERALQTAEGAIRGRSDCPGTNAVGALDRATGGDWDGQYFDGFGYSVERIFAERHAFDDPNGDYWTLWLNNRASQTGICQAELQEGDDVLFYVDRCQFDGSKCANDPVLPLELRAPADGRTDAPAEVTVVRYDAGGNAAPVEGARVVGPGVDATTGAGGRALVRFGQAGEVRLKAEKPGTARSAAEVVQVTAPAEPGAPPAPAPGPAPVAERDTAAPVTRIAGIREKQRFNRRRAPRTLRGSVAPDPSGLRMVKLSLTRSAGGRCRIYSPTRERFRGSRCGRRVYFSIGDRQDWSYLLPSRLKRGRYVLDAVAIDKAGNRDRLARGRSRVVFFVR